MARQCGVILTYADNPDQLEDCVRRGGYDTVKVVSGWGMASGWSPENMARVLNMVPNVIVRTVTGDPSSQPPDRHDNDHPDPNRVEQEIASWYQIKPTIMIEIGNEPNARYNGDEQFIWAWRYNLDASIARCREKFPQAQLIAGGLMLGRNDPHKFYAILHDVMSKCDYIGLHIYEFFAFTPANRPATTGQLAEAIALGQEFFPDKPWYITEYGINDTKAVSQHDKGWRYAGMLHFGESDPMLPANVKGAVYYHLALKGDLDQSYHIYPQGEEGFKGHVATGGPLTADTLILGPASGPIERAVVYVQAHLKPGSEYANDVGTILGYYWKYAPAVGVDPFIAAAQCVFETDSLNSAWAARPHRNPAGLGVHQEGGLAFDTWENAVQAHIGQLLAFALSDAEASDAQRQMMQKNPRHGLIALQQRGAVKTLAGLNNIWGDGDYANKLVSRANALLGA